MEDLIDIEGLDQIGYWPLAFGWWIILAVSILLLGIAIVFTYRRFKYNRSWQAQARKRLKNLQKELPNGDFKQIMQRLSVEMRKIAMQKTKREECASLTGKQWLAWLEQHDPKGYKWRANGKLLTDVQYMRNSEIADATPINELIDAALQWVKTC